MLAGFWFYANRSSAVYERIMNKDGYEVHMLLEQISTEFDVQPEWIPKQDGEETKLNLVIANQYDTDIVLESISRWDRNIVVNIQGKHKLDRHSGQFLSNTVFNPDGSYSFTNGEKRWSVTSPAGEDLLKERYGNGDGPGDQSSISIDIKYLDQMKEGFHVRFSGYNAYHYRQTQQDHSLFWLIFSLFIVIALVKLYDSRSEQERHLGWKLIGYSILGGFTFSLNSLRIPLGFILYLMFLKKDKTNSDIKHKAALLGLLVYAMPFFVSIFSS